MRLSEFVAASGLYVYAEVALVLFLIAFIGILVEVAAKRNRASFEHASSLPLDEERSRTSHREA